MLKKNCFPAFIIFLLSLVACSSGYSPEGTKEPVSHMLWDSLLMAYVDEGGKVDYAGLQQDSVRLNRYLRQMSSHPPGKDWTEKDLLAYWINVYNAFTVKLIVDAYPVESIKDLGPGFSVPLLRSVWTQKFFRIGKQQMSLDQIEHGVLRKEFEEPRIHFAINCASASCPPLRNEAYTAGALEAQLDAQARRFINGAAYNTITPEEAELSKIFSWFKGDFTREGSLIDFLNIYSEVKILPQARINFRTYDWKLNE